MRAKTPALLDRLILKRYKNKKTIYILPTKEGYYYILTCFITFLIGMGYNNNLGIMASFIMTSYLIIVMLQSNTMLKHLTISKLSIKSSFADQGLLANIMVRSEYAKEISFVTFFTGSQFAIELGSVPKIPPFYQGNLTVHLSPLNRGYYESPLVKMVSTGPNHLFKTWTYTKEKNSFTVYPKRRADKTLLKRVNSGEKQSSYEEAYYETHIPYLEGMNPKRVDWKYYAKSDLLLWKKFIASNSQSIKIDYLEILGNKEEKIEKISWLIDWCFRNNRGFSLILESKTFKTKNSTEHYHECLKEISCL